MLQTARLSGQYITLEMVQLSQRSEWLWIRRHSLFPRRDGSLQLRPERIFGYPVQYLMNKGDFNSGANSTGACLFIDERAWNYIRLYFPGCLQRIALHHMQDFNFLDACLSFVNAKLKSLQHIRRKNSVLFENICI